MGLLGQDSDVISMLCCVWIGWLTISSTSSEFSIGFKTGTHTKECTLHEQNASPIFFSFSIWYCVPLQFMRNWC